MKIDVHLTDKSEAYIIKTYILCTYMTFLDIMTGFRIFTGYTRIVMIFEH